jgi:hypothetical protein
MIYDKFLNTISEKYDKLFSEIHAEYNFDSGPEFEIALCKALRILLPSKYGICRGFIVTIDGKKAGDDIIIFDQERFPTLRLLDDTTYAQKQQIPIEAVYAYIEAKNTLCLEGYNGNSIEKAMKQVSDVKKLSRKQVPLNKITYNTTFNCKVERLEHWPQIRNPMYTAILSRGVRLHKQSKVLSSKEFFPLLQSKLCSFIGSNNKFPDLIIAGSDVICLPSIRSQIESPFFIDGVSNLTPFLSEGLGYGIGMANMFYAFDSIILGEIHWPKVIALGLNLVLNSEEV